MHTAAVACWPVDVPLPLSATVNTTGAGQRFRHHSNAMGIPRIDSTAAGPPVAPRFDEAGPHLPGVMGICGQAGGVAEHPPPPANATGRVVMRRAAFRMVTPSRCPAVPA